MERWFSWEWWEQQNWKGESTKVTKGLYHIETMHSQTAPVVQKPAEGFKDRAFQTSEEALLLCLASLYCSNSATSVTIVLYDSL